MVGERLHPRLALERGGDVGRELLGLARLPRRRLGLERGHHLGGKQLQRLADVVVAVAAGLLQEDDLVDTAFDEAGKMRAHVLRRADAGRIGADALDRGDHRFSAVAAQLHVLAPEIGAAGHGVPRHQCVDREAEELKAFVAAANSLGAVAMHGEARHHGDVGVHRMAERHAGV